MELNYPELSSPWADKENFILALQDAVKDELGFYTIVSMFALKKEYGVTIWEKLENVIGDEIHKRICAEAEKELIK